MNATDTAITITVCDEWDHCKCHWCKHEFKRRPQKASGLPKTHKCPKCKKRANILLYTCKISS